ncbi:unnamed protein product [Closterium sp. NIES-64]|nr:unnamed protein product [Closterium sp. NIES-64]
MFVNARFAGPSTQIRSRPAHFAGAPPRLARLSSARAAFFSARPPLVPATRLSVPPRRTNGGAVRVAATTSGGQGSAGSVAVGSFRAGQKRAEVRLPALLLTLTSAEVLRGGAQGSAEAVDAAVAGGATMVVVGEEGAGGAGMELFEAACAVKEVVRGRVPLLVAERADIAAAAGADGVLLSDNGRETDERSMTRSHGGMAWSHGGMAWSHGGMAWSHGGMAWSHGGMAWSHGGMAWLHGGMAWSHGGMAWLHGGMAWSHGGMAWSHGGMAWHMTRRSSQGILMASFTWCDTWSHSPLTATVLHPPPASLSLLLNPQPMWHPSHTSSLLPFILRPSHAFLCHSSPLPSASPLLPVVAPLWARPFASPRTYTHPSGLPAVAARRMMESAASGPLLPLVARRVASVAAAVTATTADGADLILLAPSAAAPGRGAISASSAGRSADAAAVAQVRARQVSIPVLVQRGEGAAWAGGEGVQWVRGVMGSGAAGVAVTLSSLLQAAATEPAEAAEGADGAEAGEVGSVAGGGESRAMRAAVGRVVGAMADARWVTKGMGEGAGEESETESEGESEEEGEEVGMGVGGAAGGEVLGRGDVEEVREEVEQVLSGVGGPPGPAAASAVAGEDVRLQVAREGEGEKGEKGGKEEEEEEEGEGREGRGLLDVEGRRIMKAERKLLSSLLALLRAACPDMAEIQLLEDSLARLGEPFLVVVVGEFNSGKSSLVNALLGDAFLKVGVVPTTNEITLLRHLDTSPSSQLRARAAQAASSAALSAAAAGSQRGAVAGRAAARAVAGRMAVEEQRHPDGHMIRFLPADLLKQMNVVDTPGTNVILERQQRLTEEFVPQADLVLFVLSADRPLTESEVSFLRYIRQWGKKVVFALNKVDSLSSPADVREVQEFVTANVKRLLAVDTVLCFPLASRPALAAKLLHNAPYPFPPAPSPALSSSSAALPPPDPAAQAAAVRLRNDPSYQASGFADLEIFIQQFLEGSSDAGAERLRLKLDTPLGVASALLAGAEAQLTAQAEAAARDDEALAAVEAQMEGYGAAMRTDSLLQRSRVAVLVREAAGRAEEFVEATLRLGNADVMIQYLFSPPGGGGGGSGDGASGSGGMLPVSKSFQTQIVGTVVADVRRALVEHHVWLRSNNARQLASYRDFARTRWPSVPPAPALPGSEEEGEGEGEEGRIPETVGILEGFSPRAAALLLEEEMRESVVSTVTGLGVAGVSASVLTAVLQSSLEDLLALTVCTAGGSLNVLTFPQRREKVKGKIRQRAAGLIKRLEEGLEGELQSRLADLETRIRAELAPYRRAVDDELVRVDALQSQLQMSTQQLEELRQRVRNLAV